MIDTEAEPVSIAVDGGEIVYIEVHRDSARLPLPPHHSAQHRIFPSHHIHKRLRFYLFFVMMMMISIENPNSPIHPDCELGLQTAEERG